MNKEVIDQAIHFEGNVPEEWELLGVRENAKYRFWYYRDLEGNCYFTSRRIERPVGYFELREDEGKRLFAKKVYKRKRYVS